jgi:pimeloyl-ACP methyl ester carboxylesterase
MLYNEGYLDGGRGFGPMFFRSWTPPARTASALYLHGVGGNSADCRRLAERLIGIGCGTIAVDMPGNGFSPAGTLPRGERLLAQMRFLRGVIPDPRRERAVLVCDSGGALLGLSLLHAVRNDPAFAGIPVVFSEGVFGHDSSTHRFIESCLGFYGRSYPSLEAAIAGWNACELGKVAFDSDADRREFVAGLLHADGRALVPKGDVSRQRELARSKDFEMLPGKPPLQNPALFLWSEGGRLAAKYAEAARQVFPRSIVHMARGAGHPLPIVREAELQAVQSFLSGQLGGWSML